MRLIGKTAFERDRSRASSLTQQMPCSADADISEIGMRRDVKFAAKGADQMRTAETCHSRQFFQPDIRIEIVVKIFAR